MSIAPNLIRYDPLMPLHSTHADNHAVVCVPGAGASVTSFIALAGALGESNPIFGLQPRGLDLAYPPYQTVVEAANCNLAAISKLHRARPIHLIGHSYGGLVAFEMAMHLEQTGGPVASLTLIDSDPPSHAHQSLIPPTVPELFQSFLAVFEDSYEIDLNLDQSLITSGIQTLFLTGLRSALIAKKCLPATSDLSALQASFATFAAALADQYTPSGIRSGPTHLVQVRSRRLNKAEDDKRMASDAAMWQLFSPALTIWPGPGHHFSILRTPHVSSLAQWWRTAHP